jgi:hypothetical protein
MTKKQSDNKEQISSLFNDLVTTVKTHGDNGTSVENIIGSLMSLGVMMVQQTGGAREDYLKACEMAWDQIAPHAPTPKDEEEYKEKCKVLALKLVDAINEADLPTQPTLNAIGNVFIQTCHQLKMTEDRLLDYCKKAWKICEGQDG